MTSPASFNTKTLCFVDHGVERGFLKSRQAKLRNNVAYASSLSSAYVLALLLTHWLTDWSTGGAVFIDSTAGIAIAKVRAGMLFVILMISIIAIVNAKVRRVNAFLGLEGFEMFTFVIICLLSLCITVQHPSIIAKIMGASHPELVVRDMIGYTDDRLMFILSVVVSTWHLMLPIRWAKIWPAELITICLGPAVALGGQARPSRVALNTVLMAIAVYSAASGMRQRESHERAVFAQLATEKTLRCAAEHMLSVSNQDKTKRCEADLVSIAATSNTTDVFDLRRGADDNVGIRLEQIHALGLREHWLISPEGLHLFQDRVLGKGGFGMALVALYHGTEVVLKIPRESFDNGSRKKLASIADELRSFRRLHHPNIVTFYGACIGLENYEIVLVMEYIRGVQLRKAISGIPTTVVDICDRCGLVENICSALRYLHAQSPAVVHGDIKACNVLVEEHGTRRNARLLDFGLSRLVTARARKLGGTLGWMAPEVFRGEDHATQPSADIFSLGYLVYMITTGADPFHHVRDTRRAVELAQHGDRVDLEWPEEMPLYDDVRKMCEACLSIHAECRPTILQVHESLRGWGKQLGLTRLFQQPFDSSHLWHTLREARSGQIEKQAEAAFVESFRDTLVSESQRMTVESFRGTLVSESSIKVFSL